MRVLNELHSKLLGSENSDKHEYDYKVTSPYFKFITKNAELQRHDFQDFVVHNNNEGRDSSELDKLSQEEVIRLANKFMGQRYPKEE